MLRLETRVSGSGTSQRSSVLGSSSGIYDTDCFHLRQKSHGRYFRNQRDEVAAQRDTVPETKTNASKRTGETGGRTEVMVRRLIPVVHSDTMSHSVPYFPLPSYASIHPPFRRLISASRRTLQHVFSFHALLYYPGVHYNMHSLSTSYSTTCDLPFRTVFLHRMTYHAPFPSSSKL